MRLKVKVKTIVRFCLFIISSYLILGNIPRIIRIPGFTNNNLVITEFILYFVLIFSALLIHKIYINFTNIATLTLIILFSFVYGISVSGFATMSLLYSIRLLLMFLCGNIGGYFLFKLYNTNIISTLKFFIKTYFILFLLGTAIYIAFPDSVSLWNFLSSYGIIFSGDPHQNRFVSSMFDPNFYGGIVLIPIIMSSFLFKETGRRKYFILFICFLISLFLTYSRSGIGAAIIFCSVSLMRRLFFYRPKINIKRFIIILYSIPVICFVIYLHSKVFLRIVNRFSGIATDNSALARLNTFNLGYEMLKKTPLMGMGYDNLSVKMRSLSTLTSIDSSLLSILINFGVVLSLILLYIFLKFIIQTRNRIKNKFKENLIYLRFFESFTIYIFISIFFTSQFNNLLFYQFWLFPCVVIYSYIKNVSYSKKAINNLQENYNTK